MPRGTAGPRPTKPDGGGKFRKSSFALTETIDRQRTLKSGEVVQASRFLGNLWIPRNKKDVPLVVLDHGSEFDYHVRLHFNFDYNNDFRNILVCAQHARDEGCAACEVIPKRSTYYSVATVLNLSTVNRTIDGQKKPVSAWRELVFIPERQIDDMDALMKKAGGARGSCFDVSRGDSQMSPRIGSSWWPSGKLTENQMIEMFEEAASDYGLPVEQFIAPVDYEKVLAPLSVEDMAEAAALIKAEADSSSSDSTSGDVIPF